MKSLFTIFVTVLLAACSQAPAEDTRFEKLANQFIEAFLEMHPEWATGLGDHRYDHRLGDYSLDSVEKGKTLLHSYRDSLKTIDATGLNEANRIDYQILAHNLEAMLFQYEVLREYEWNPRVYNIGGAVYGLIARDFAPLKERLLNLKERLKGIPEVLEHAKKNLKNPPKIHTETAILQNKGNINMIESELDRFLDEVPELKDEFQPVREQAVAALEAYGKWLEEDLLPRSDGDFRLGDEKYRQKLKFTLESDFSKEEILQRAEADLRETQNVMHQTAQELYKQYFGTDATDDKKQVIKAVLDKLAEDRPDNETIVALAEEKLQTATEFTAEHKLVTIPNEPVKIIVMPEFQRGVAVAYCDSPGPLEEKGETFYAISPTPENWTPERVTSFFREYNNYMLDNLTIHEAVPGHYLQLALSNKFKAPTSIRSIFQSGTFIEGWATYAEQLMAEKGYGGPQVKMQQLKMRLRLIINAIIDQKIHTAGMTEQQAMDLMMNEGFQEEGEAAGKWRRACLTSTQLSTYYVGNSEINDLRKGYETKHGSNAVMQKMHDAMLSFGSPAPRYVKELLGI